jgi:hypothetical protein
MYHQKNFHRKTFCEFIYVSPEDLPKTAPNHVSSSGSRYFFTPEGVYRISNHWGRAAACRWRLKGFDGKIAKHIPAGFAKWSDFYPYDPQKYWFYIRNDFNEIGHRLDAYYTLEAVCFDEKEAVKRVKWLQNHATNDLLETYFDRDLDEKTCFDIRNTLRTSRLQIHQILKNFFEN